MTVREGFSTVLSGQGTKSLSADVPGTVTSS